MEGNLVNLPVSVVVESAGVSIIICLIWYFTLKDVILKHPVAGVMLFTSLNFVSAIGYFMVKLYGF